MSIIGVDSSGQIGNPPTIMAAVRKPRKKEQKHEILKLSKKREYRYEKRIKGRSRDKGESSKDWKLKLSAALIFCAVKEIIIRDCEIHMDIDFGGGNQSRLNYYLGKLFREIYEGKDPISRSTIEFIPKKECDMVYLAHQKHGWAKEKKYEDVKFKRCPDLTNYLKIID